MSKESKGYAIQQEYADKRRRALHKNDDDKTDAVRRVVEELRTQHFRMNGKDDWLKTYKEISDSLRAADLTINLEAATWFLKENTYKTYKQMYQKGIGADGKMVLKDNKLNPAKARATADDKVTLPEEWGSAHRFSQRKKLWNAMSASGSATPKAKSANRDARGADATGSKLVSGAGEGEWVTTNRHFNPHAKQVFAALNYGKRCHGASTEYGFSYLKLNPELKRKALYYPMDTFNLAGATEAKHSARAVHRQATYETLGVVLMAASDQMKKELWKSCVNGFRLEDTNDRYRLLEAHLFGEVRIKQDVETLFLSRKRQDADTPFTEEQWETIIQNSLGWAQENAVRIVLLD